MNIFFDNEQLLQLITNLYTLTGIRANIFDINGRDICLTGDHMPFCERINACPQGHARCESCDAQAVQLCGTTAGVHYYRCHAGVCEAILPILSGGSPIAYLVFGQFLDESPLELQWEQSCQSLDWYPGGGAALQDAYLQFRQYTDKEILAYSEILEALASYIQLKGMIRTAGYTDQQRLELYLDEHYMEKLSLASISAELHIGRTRLCALAKQLSHGHTLSHLIAQRRVEAAKDLLSHSTDPISAVAERVGISDYNYFTKVFRSLTGMTPSAFRRANRSGHTEKAPGKIV